MPGGGYWTQFRPDSWHMLPPLQTIASTDQNNISGTTTAQRVTATPFWTGAADISVDAWGYLVNGATALAITAAIYEAKGPTDPYPGDLLVDGGSVTAAGAGFNSTTFTEVTMSANTMYWIATRIVTAPAATASVMTTHIKASFMPWQTTDAVANVANTKTGPLSATSFGTSWPDPFTAGVAPVNLSSFPATLWRISDYGAVVE